MYFMGRSARMGAVRGSPIGLRSQSNRHLRTIKILLVFGLRLRSPFRLLVTVTNQEFKDDKRNPFNDTGILALTV
jgi:hypothetical protein